jgi:hypothetical protein
LTEIKINEVLRLMSYIRSKIAANDAMPSGVVLLVKLLLDISGNILRRYHGIGIGIGNQQILLFKAIPKCR